MNLTQLSKTYRDTLLKDVIPFWLKHGMDRKHAGTPPAGTVS